MHDDLVAHHHDGQVSEFGEEEEHPLWKLDAISLTSVGIDVGTATSQIIFSRLLLRRLGLELSSRFVVVSREVLYRSPVHFTPYTRGRERIDGQALGRLVDAAYQAAGVGSEDVDTGAIILTGEAIRRDNARAIADLFAEQRGSFVCATAGHNFEAVLAAHGSGAVALSEERACRILNVDIGGGTTKLAVVDCGRIEQTAAFHVGGRLIAIDENGRLTVLEPGGEAISRQLGYGWHTGEPIGHADLERVAGWMANAVLAIATDVQHAPELDWLFLTPPLDGPRDYDGVVFSGGVGEYVYGKEPASFGDLGEPLGQAIHQQIAAGALPWPLLPARECIRATVMGASQYTVQVSGNTIFGSDSGLLPRRNLQVLRPDVELGGTIEPEQVAGAIKSHFASFDLQEGEADVALVFRWKDDPSARRLDAFCRGLMQGLSRTLDRGHPLYLVFDRDIGGLIGALLREECGVLSPILSIDGIALSDFDFIDLGRVLEPSGTVPVTIKSLVFQL